MILTELRRHNDRSPEGVAFRAATETGWTETTWAQLYGDTLAVAARAGELSGAVPVVVAVDGGAASAATVLGLVAAGVDVLLVEEQASYLTDDGPVRTRLRASTVVGPAGMTGATLSYAACRGPAAGHTAPTASRTAEILQLTSGSTGEPRIARQPFRNVERGAATYRRIFELTDRDAVLAAVPLAHSFGFIGGLAAALVSGAALWSLPRFSLRRLCEGLEQGATVLLGSPLVYRLLAPVLRRAHGAGRLRIALSSGGPLAAGLADEVGEGLGVPVRQVYGSTETGLIACQYGPVESWPVDCVGTAAPGVRLRVDGSGQLYLHTPTLFSGYLGGAGPELTDDGCYPTGDVARIDAHGRVFLVGRKDTFVNVGGRKVNPRRIERILAECPGVREAYVFGTAPSGEEEQITAVVVLSPDSAIEDVAAFCRARRLMPYEVPHAFHTMDRLPRTPMGKVDRQAVIARTAKARAT